MEDSVMEKQLNQLREFQLAFKSPVLDVPTIPSEARIFLRLCNST